MQQNTAAISSGVTDCQQSSAEMGCTVASFARNPRFICVVEADVLALH